MSETKWTPGPWKIAQRERGYWPYVERGENGTNVIQSKLSLENADADAALISSAPRLYAALDSVMREIVGEQYTGRTDLDDQIVTEAWAALKQARGEMP